MRLLAATNNYSGDEELTAAYVMATVNIGSKLTIIPGIRYQSLKTNYLGIRGQQSALSYYAYDHSDTTVSVTHTNWLPNFNLKLIPHSSEDEKERQLIIEKKEIYSLSLSLATNILRAETAAIVAVTIVNYHLNFS